MSGLIERLHRFAWVFTSGSLECGLAREAAAEIEQLTAALATARNDALEEAAKSALDVRGCAKNLLAVIAAEVSIHSKTPAFRQAVSDMRDALKGDV